MIFLITDRLICETSLLTKINELVEENKIDQIILREKDLDDEKLYNLYIEIQKIIKNSRIHLIVNASLTFAKKYELKGIHLSQKNFDEINSKKEIEDISFGVSVHSLKEIESALEFEPDYLLLSPVFKTNCKKSQKPLGIEFLKKIQRITDIPLIALGGIDEEKISQLKKVNIDNFAMRSNLLI